MARCDCGGNIVPVWFVEQERIRNIPTGRERNAVSHLECDNCLKRICIDDSMDGQWVRKDKLHK